MRSYSRIQRECHLPPGSCRSPLLYIFYIRCRSFPLRAYRAISAKYFSKVFYHSAMITAGTKMHLHFSIYLLLINYTLTLRPSRLDKLTLPATLFIYFSTYISCATTRVLPRISVNTRTAAREIKCHRSTRPRFSTMFDDTRTRHDATIAALFVTYAVIRIYYRKSPVSPPQLPVAVEKFHIAA